MSSNPKPKLHDDILIDTVEKMFFQKPDGVDAIDLCMENSYTFFMALKPVTETAFIRQFSKLRRVEFQNEEEKTIEFYKEEEKPVVYPDELFTGPWLVSNKILEEIIRRKKLRVTKVVSELYLEDRETCDLGTNPSSLEAFCALFLGKKLDIPDSMPYDNELAINILEIYEYPEDIKKNFEAIHAINSKKLVIDTFTGDFFSVCSSLPRSQITADKTLKIAIKTRGEINKFMISNLMIYANFVIETCPILTTLNFDIRTNGTYDPNIYAEKLNTILSTFLNQYLKQLEKGHSTLKICLTWNGTCSVANIHDIPRAQELFTLGTKVMIETEDTYLRLREIARIVKETDAKGREHECSIKILVIEKILSSDSSEDSSEEESGY